MPRRHTSVTPRSLHRGSLRPPQKAGLAWRIAIIARQKKNSERTEELSGWTLLRPAGPSAPLANPPRLWRPSSPTLAICVTHCGTTGRPRRGAQTEERRPRDEQDQQATHEQHHTGVQRGTERAVPEIHRASDLRVCSRVPRAP